MAFKPIKRCEKCGAILVKVLNRDDEWEIVHLAGYTKECVING